jgi:hypothetical protein
MLIGSVSTVALNHIGLLIVDEIQNVVNSKNGAVVVGMLTQLINNAGISICMVGTPKSALFFSQEMMLARRSLGLSYGPFSYDDTFTGFCEELFQYQYVQQKASLDEGMLQWLYNHSHGNASIVVSLIHDAQEIAILSGSESMDLRSLEEAYRQRLTMLHGYLAVEPLPSSSTVGSSKARKKKTDQEPEKAETDEALIASLSQIAKRERKNMANLLMEHNLLEEVAL